VYGEPACPTGVSARTHKGKLHILTLKFGGPVPQLTEGLFWQVAGQQFPIAGGGFGCPLGGRRPLRLVAHDLSSPDHRPAILLSLPGHRRRDRIRAQSLPPDSPPAQASQPNGQPTSLTLRNRWRHDHVPLLPGLPLGRVARLLALHHSKGPRKFRPFPTSGSGEIRVIKAPAKKHTRQVQFSFFKPNSAAFCTYISPLSGKLLTR
jgi:hypothetical protein